MHRKFHEKFGEMLGRDVSFVVATVISVRGSAAARTGAKAIIDDEGRPVFGWVGGGCVESFVCREAKEALAAGAPRIITADLEDELTGVGLPCGGVMEIFIEPVTPRRRVLVIGESESARLAARLSERVGFNVTQYLSAPRPSQEEEQAGVSVRSLESASATRGSLVIIAPEDDEDLRGLSRMLEAAPDYVALLPNLQARALEELWPRGVEVEGVAATRLRFGLDLGGTSAAEIALSIVGEMLAATRGARPRPLQEIKMGETVKALEDVEAVEARAPRPALLIIGHSEITEELAWLAHELGWRVQLDSSNAPQESYPPGVEIVRDDADFSRLPAGPETAVIVATHHKGDQLAIERALSAGAWYVGLIASAHRSKLVRAMLEEMIPGDERLRLTLRTPSGLDLGATTPSEIALSIMSEVVACFHNRTGRPRVHAQSYEESHG